MTADQSGALVDFVLIIIIVIVIWLALREFFHSEQNHTTEKPAPRRAMKCPYCGSPVMIRGSYWECGYCGDSGRLSR